MPLQYKVFTLGQMQNNTIVVYEDLSKIGYIIDPSFQNQPVLDFIHQQAITIEKIICTHAHFDHFAGVPFFKEFLSPSPAVLINKKDLPLWQDGGGSKQFNYLIKLPPEPDEFLTDNQVLTLGGEQIEIRAVPGHSPGSIVLRIPSLMLVISGDTLFRESIGRTDLQDGDHDLLVAGIAAQILSLPGDFIVIPGHGETTTVSHEKAFNPFLSAR
jgi:glyoxylase-like metal-dependent hydrolase (beta-lactamase superfamily II)